MKKKIVIGLIISITAFFIGLYYQSFNEHDLKRFFFDLTFLSLFGSIYFSAFFIWGLFNNLQFFPISLPYGPGVENSGNGYYWIPLLFLLIGVVVRFFLKFPKNIFLNIVLTILFVNLFVLVGSCIAYIFFFEEGPSCCQGCLCEYK